MTEYEVRYGASPIVEGRRFGFDEYPDAVTFFAAAVLNFQTNPEYPAAWASFTERNGEIGRLLVSWTKISENERPLSEGTPL